MQLSRPFAPLLVLAALAGAAALPAGAQGLNGQAVQETFRYPDSATVLRNDGTQVVTPTGVTYTDLVGAGAVTTVLKPTQVTFTFGTGGVAFPSTTFIGYVLSETGLLPATITGVSVASSTVSGFDASRVSFDSTDIFANFQFLPALNGQAVTLNFTTSALSSTPEPSSVAAFGFTALGIGGLMLRARKRRLPGV